MSYQPPSYPQPYPPNQPTGQPTAQGYPPQYPEYPGQQMQPNQPPQGYPPQYPGYPGAQPGFPPAAGYPGYPAQQRPFTVERNPIATRSLIVGAIAFVVTIVAAFFGYYIVGLLSILAVVYGIMGLVRALNLPQRTGLWPSIGGVVLGGLALLITILIII